jgi:prepilin-type N-terminal cleavage/methylation domain-containing protein
MARRSAIEGLHHFAGLDASPACTGGLAAPKFRRKRNVGGFTLLEIVVVLALFALITALLIGGSGSLLRAIGREEVENTALNAIASARHEAVLSGRTLDLRLDEKTRVLDWGAGRATLAGEEAVRLLPPVKTSSVLIGGRLEKAAITDVRFYPDGTCDPFRVEIVRGQSGRILLIDPWTCTVLAPDSKARSR